MSMIPQTANGPPGMIIAQPPPRTKSLPSATCAESASMRFTLNTASLLPSAMSDPGAVPVVVVGSAFVTDGRRFAAASDGYPLGDHRPGCYVHRVPSARHRFAYARHLTEGRW